MSALDGPHPPIESWHRLSVEAASRRLATDPVTGLTGLEAERRRHRWGANRIPEPRREGPLPILLRQFADVMVLLLLGAAVVGAMIGEPQDSIAIAVIVLLNAGLGFVQEYRTERALAALRAMATPLARVRRENALLTLPAEQIVPGDVVLLQAGDAVPADLRLVEAVQLRMDESTLTGESAAVEKQVAPLGPEAVPLADRTNLAFAGSLVTHGRGLGLVVATGPASELGKISLLVEAADREPTPLQRRLERLGRQLALAALAVCAVVFAAGLLRGEPALLMLLTALSLAVAAVPEALPAVVTVSLARGAQALARRQALVRRLPAVETLGSVTCIGADKTGTLTQNRMEVTTASVDGVEGAWPTRTPEPSESWPRLLEALVLCNDAARRADGSLAGESTEVALLRAAITLGADPERLQGRHHRIAEIPFDPGRGRMTTLHQDGDGVIAFTKGATERILEACRAGSTSTGIAPLDSAVVLGAAERMAKQGLRVLAVAWRRWSHPPGEVSLQQLERDLILLGLVGIEDPLRPEAAPAVSVCRSAGVVPIMITGDHAGTARTIARRAGLLENDDEALLTGSELEQLDEATLEQRVGLARVYARVAPEQKFAIVTALQRRGEVVAMTGDGVNDVPALRQADIGIAMGRSGTEVAREAADLVLLDDNFATIVGAIREGRRIYDNIRKFVRYVLTGNAGEIWTLFLAPFLGLPLPLLPIHILWVNLVTDGLPGLAFVAEPEEPGVMTRPPRPPRESIFAAGLWQHVVWGGLLIGAVSLLAQAWSYRSGTGHWRTVTFCTLATCQLAHALAIRSEREAAWRSFFANRALVISAGVTLVLQLAILYLEPLQRVFKTSPLGPGEWAVCLAASGAVFAAVELEKWLIRRGRLYRQPVAAPR